MLPRIHNKGRNIDPLVGKTLIRLLTIIESMIFFLFFNVGCDDPPQTFDCPDYFHPCEDNPAQCCPDTTSHTYFWEIDSLGTLTSYLSDVAVISEDDIWVVGSIHTPDTDKFDSSGVWQPPYNAVYWDGATWQYHLIKTQVTRVDGKIDTGRVNIRSIFAFGGDDVWFNHGGAQLTQWDGHDFHYFSPSVHIPIGGTINKIWGTSGSNMYLVGHGGLILHFDGSDFIRIWNYSTVHLRDIWGSQDGTVIWAVGYDDRNGTSVLLRYDGNSWDIHWNIQYSEGTYTVNDESQPYIGLLSSLWPATADSLIVVGGEGVWWQHVNGGQARAEDIWLRDFPLRVRTNGRSDLFAVGDRGIVWHFNGASWRKFDELRNPSYVFKSIDLVGDMIVIVGNDYSAGIQRDIIVTGQR